MEESNKKSLFNRVVNSKKSVIMYIVTLTIFYVGALIGAMIIVNRIFPFEELMILCRELIKQNLGIFTIYVIFAIIIFFTVAPIVGIFVCFLPCLIISILIWIIYIIIIALRKDKDEL